MLSIFEPEIYRIHKKKHDANIKNLYTWAKSYASQSKAVVKPSLLETNNAHFNVEDSAYSYYVCEKSSEIKSVKTILTFLRNWLN